MSAGTQEPRLACIKTYDGRIDVWVIEDEGRELVFKTPTPGVGDAPLRKRDPETGAEYIPDRAEDHTGLFFPLEAERVRRAYEVLSGEFPSHVKAAARRLLRRHRERVVTREMPYDVALRRLRHQAGVAPAPSGRMNRDLLGVHEREVRRLRHKTGRAS